MKNLHLLKRHLVGNILLGFAQTECAVSDYWTQKVVSWFPKHEIQQMAMMFGSQETIHAVAYSYLNETLGLEDFEAFLHEPATADRFENLVSYEGKDKVGIAKSLAVFSAFAEGVSLYSAFAVLYSFQLRNLLKGIGQQMKWSVRDESLHSKMGCQLFRHMCEETPGLKQECKDHVLEAADIMVDLELKYIDKMFEQGDIENLKKEDLKNFIKKRANEKIVELGYNEVFATISDMMQPALVLWIGFIILLGVLLTPIFLLSGLLTILKQTREKILKIFGSILLLFLISCSNPEVECSNEKK